MKKKKKSIIAPEKKFFNPRSRQDLWDADYLDKLSPEELAWYKKFNFEYANATIDLNKDPLIEEYARVNNLKYRRAKTEMIGGGYTPKKNEGKPKKGHIHKTREQAKEIFDNNNKRNNDLFGVTKINGLLKYDVHTLSNNTDIWHETDPNVTEDTLIRMLDEKLKKKDS